MKVHHSVESVCQNLNNMQYRKEMKTKTFIIRYYGNVLLEYVLKIFLVTVLCLGVCSVEVWDNFCSPSLISTLVILMNESLELLCH